MQTITLAKLSKGRIDAVDNHQSFLEQLKKKAAEEGVSDKITVVNGDMAALNYEDGSFDLVWSEGAIFVIARACSNLLVWKLSFFQRFQQLRLVCALHSLPIKNGELDFL
jgi:cyclopropane fatty-acyl-phospholipid synthase-like methyltransferase